MSAIRKIKRNIVRAEIGNNNISETWYKMQVAKYGLQRYCDIRNKNRKVVKMNQKRQHKVGLKFSITDKGITTSYV